MNRDLNLSSEAPTSSPTAGNHLQSVNGCLACFVRAVQELSQARSVERIREIVRHAARDLTGADGATIILRDGDKCHYVDEDAIAPLWKGMRFPMEARISGWAMLNGQPAVKRLVMWRTARSNRAPDLQFLYGAQGEGRQTQRREETRQQRTPL